MSPSTQCIGSVVPLTIFHLYAMKSSKYEIQRANPTRLEALLRISGKDVDNWTKTWTRPLECRKKTEQTKLHQHNHRHHHHRNHDHQHH